MRKSLSFIIIGLLLVSATRASFMQSPVNADSLEKEISILHAEQLKKLQTKNAYSSLKEAQMLGAANFECTGGKNPAKMTNKEYLDAFASGPCTPIIYLAGVTGTKLQVEVTCDELRANHPKVFETCGWTTCSATIIGSTPKPEYTIWIPDLGSPFSLITTSEKTRQCMASLLGFSWSANDGKLFHNAIKGIKVSPMGFTSGSRKTSKCGFDAIGNMLPLLEMMTPTKFKLFNIIKASLEGRGYRAGLTMQALPYDWRKTFYSNEVSERFEALVKSMYNISGKKVSVAAHSMGNMNILNVMSKMTQEDKDKYIRRFFALAPPFLGSPTAYSMPIGGSDQYNFGGFGLNFWLFKRSIASFPSIFDLMPRLSWLMYSSAPWMKSIRNRMSIEKNGTPVEVISQEEDIVSKIFPKPTEDCYGSKTWKERTSKCHLLIEDFNNLGKINGETVTISNIKEIFGKYSYEPQSQSLYENENRRASYDAMVNPGIETVVVYSNINPTKKEFFWNSDPKLKALDDSSDFVKADKMTFAMGDGTVLTASMIAPSLKWAYEFDTKQANSKPIVFAEVCSQYNLKRNVYQSGSSQDKDLFKNEYQGIDCNCNKGGEASCDHMGIITDPKVMDYIINSLMDGPSAVGLARTFDTKTHAEIDAFATSCELLN